MTNIIWMFADKGFRVFSELIVGLFVARYLGVELFGLFSFAISYMIIVSGVSSLGLQGLLTRELVNFKLRRNELIGTALSLRLVVSLLVIAGIIASSHYISLTETGKLVVFIISWSIFWKSFEILESYFQAEVESAKIAKIHIFSGLLFSLIKLSLIAGTASLPYFAVAYTLEWLVNAVGLYFFYSKERNPLHLKFSKKIAFILLRNGWYLLVSGLAVDLYMRLDQVMIRQMIGDSANGNYAAATRISEIWYAIPVIICSVIFPALLNSRKTNREQYDRRILLLFSLMFWLALLISLLIVPFSKFIIVFLYSESYANAASVLSIHIWTSVFVFWGVSTTYWSLSENLQHISLVRTLFGLLINIGLNIILIPTAGINGAAIATLISQAFASTLSLVFFKKTRSVVFLQLKSILYPLSLLKRNSASE